MIRTLPLLLLATASALQAGIPAMIKASAKNPKAPPAAAILPPVASPWRISAGAQWRTLGDASFNNDSQASGFRLPNFSGLAGGNRATGGYRDGYVQPDISGSSVSTWNFGFNNATQAQGDTLALHGSSISVITKTQSQNFDSDAEEAANGFGVFLKLESPELLGWQIKGRALGPPSAVSVSAVFGYSFTRADIDQSTLAFAATQRTTIREGVFTDRYAVLGALPSAPHAGTFNGPGPVIALSPTRSFTRGAISDVIETHIESTLRNELEVNLHTLSLGPQFSLERERLRLGLSLGLAVNIADWNASTTEQLKVKGGRTLAAWHSEANGTDVLPGFYLEANASYALSPRWSLQSFTRYDWSEALQGNAGDSSFQLDLTGWTLGLGAQYRF